MLARGCFISWLKVLQLGRPVSSRLSRAPEFSRILIQDHKATIVRSLIELEGLTGRVLELPCRPLLLQLPLFLLDLKLNIGQLLLQLQLPLVDHLCKHRTMI